MGRTRIYEFNPKYQFLGELKPLLEKALSFYPKEIQENLIMNRRRPRRRNKHISHLAEKSIKVVLSGGASVSLYSNNEYISKDIDLIDVYSVSRRKLILAMKEIGCIEENRYFRHPESPS